MNTHQQQPQPEQQNCQIGPQYGLDPSERYSYKIKKFCGGVDPYEIQPDKIKLPTNISLIEVATYLIKHLSSYSYDSFKAYKSMEAYKFYKDGWVQEIGSIQTSCGWIVIGKVKHSQKFNDKLLNPGIATDYQGTVTCAHCNCMAGLGEACNHIGIILFCLADWSVKSDEIQLQDSCTDILQMWLEPPRKKIAMSKVQDIQWVNKNKKLNTNVEQSELPAAFTDQQINNILDKIKAAGEICNLMTVRHPYNLQFTCTLRTDDNDQLVIYNNANNVSNINDTAGEYCSELIAVNDKTNSEAEDLETPAILKLYLANLFNDSVI